MKNIGNLFVRLFVVSLLAFRYFSTIVSLFGAGAAPFFTAPAPAPAPNKQFRRLRLRLRLRPKCVGSGGSGSGSGSASLILKILYWGAQLNFMFSLPQLHTKSLCVLALQNSQFEASTSSRPQTVNFEALGYKAIFMCESSGADLLRIVRKIIVTTLCCRNSWNKLIFSQFFCTILLFEIISVIFDLYLLFSKRNYL